MAVALDQLSGDGPRRDPIHTLLAILEDFVQMIKQETDPGWDWTEGLKAQIDQMQFLKGMYRSSFEGQD